MDGLVKQSEREEKALQELNERAEKTLPIIKNRIDAFMEKHKATIVAAYSLALSYTQLEYNWLPKQFKEQLLVMYK